MEIPSPFIQLRNMLDTTIFNVGKVDYKNTGSIFLGEANGLFDTINKNHPKIWEIYKNLKSLDWDELEFQFKQCNVEFKTRPASIVDRMIKTLGWQWEADTSAANSVISVMAPFLSSSEAQAAWTLITANEVVHAATYSEIVKYGFDDGNTIMSTVLAEKRSLERLTTITKVMGACKRVAYEYALGQRPNDQETYNHAYLMTVALLILERVQFMASFAITFAIGETQAFMQIVEAVKRICQDEFEVHVEMDKAVLLNEHQTERGKIARVQTLPMVRQMLTDATRQEHDWVDYMRMDEDPLTGLNGKYLKQWVNHCVGDVCEFLEIEGPSGLVIPKKNPLGYMATYMDLSKTQGSAQEQLLGAYKVNVMTRDDADKVYAIDF